MARKKISELEAATDVTANDLIQVVDVEDGDMAPSGTNKKATASLLARELAKQPLEPGIVISGSSSSDAVRITQTGAGNALVVEDSTNPDSTPFVVMANGNVGVGTSTPQGLLQVVAGASNSVIIGGPVNIATGGTVFAANESSSALAPLEFGASSFLFSIGNVGIGTSSLTYQLQLSTDSAAKPSTSTWTVSSDERLKENIEAADLDICYNAVKSIPLKRYKWKDEIYSAEQVSDRSKIGWIAQDVQAVFPKAVNEHKFVYNQVKDEDGNLVSEDSIDDCLSLNSDQIYAALFGAVQKLMGEVESLQGRISELEDAP